MKYLLLVSSLVSLLVSSTTASYGNSTILTSTSHKTASSSMTINPSSAKSSTSIISSAIVAPTTTDVSSQTSQTGTSSHTASPSTPIVPTASPSTPIVPTPSKSSASPSSSVPHTSPTTPTPSPTPSPTTVEFDYKKNNVICVAVTGIISLTVMNGTTTNPPVQVTGNATKISGTCFNGSTSSIYASWKNIGIMIGMKFEFLNDDSWFLQTIEAEVSKNKSHGAVSANATFTSMRDDGLYQGSANQSYTCTAEKKLVLSGDKGNIAVHFRDLKIQPFSVKGSKFPNPKSCPNGSDNEPNSIVPIAVGCALAGLIVIVLIAYLIGRRKSNKGYQQV